MNFRLTAVLIGLVLLLVLGLLVSSFFGDKPADAVVLEPLAGVKADEIDQVELLRSEPAEEKLTFAKADGRWEMRQPTTAAVEQAVVDDLVRDVLALKPTAYPELSGDPAAHGLDRPTLRVTLRKGSERSATLNVGQTTAGKDKAVTFVAAGDRPKTPLAVRRADLGGLLKDDGAGPAWQLARWATDFRAKRLLAAGVADAVNGIKAVKLSRGKNALALSQTPGGEWKFDAPGSGAADAAGDPQPRTDVFTGVNPLLQALVGLQALGNDDFIEKPDPDPAKYGLKPDDPNRIRVEIAPKTGPPEVAYIGKKVDGPGATKHYARREGDAAVVRVFADKIDQLARTIADPTELKDRTLVPAARKEQIDAADVAVGASTIKLRKIPVGAGRPQWVLYGGPTDPQVAAPAADELIAALTLPRAAKDVLAAPNPAAFDPKEVKAEVRLWYDAVPADAKAETADKLPAEPKLKADKPSVTLKFGKKEGDVVYVRRESDAGVADMKLSELLLAKATADRLAYVPTRLKPFATNAAGKLAFNRDAEPFELDKSDKPDPDHPLGRWTFGKPDRLKGQTADGLKVNDLLGVLATLQPGRVIAEQPAPADLKRWGLDPVRTKAVVTLRDGPDKERVFEFGAETDDKQSVYARQPGRPVVFTVPKPAYDRLATADLRDLTVYRLDPAKVTKLTLRGWKKLLGAPVEYVFEKKGADWTTAKSPTPLVADPAKLNALVANLAAPKAVAFVPGGAKPEHGLDPAAGDNTLVVAAEVQGQKDPVTLTLGTSPDADQTFYAATSAKPGEVFTVGGAVFKLYKEKPAYLGK